jgi:hypothetical protein
MGQYYYDEYISCANAAQLRVNLTFCAVRAGALKASLDPE